MGGWGAFWIGLRHREIFKGISAHSAITNIDEMSDFVEEDWAFWKRNNHTQNIIELFETTKKTPPFRFDCGTDDPLLGGNRKLHEFFVRKNLPHIYEEFSGGHEWSYWEENVEHTFKFFNSLRE
jgi:enterochelin esterase-like enzyme